MFYGITDLATFIIGTIGVILLPGPNSLYVVTTAGQFGIKKGFGAMLGVFVGDSVLMFLTAVGAAGLLRTYPALFTILKVLGGLYLLYLGVGLIIAGFKKWFSKTPGEEIIGKIKLKEHNSFYRALTLSLLNPKAILFYLSFFIQFVDPNYERPFLSFFILAVILQIISMTYLATLIFAGHALTEAFRKMRRLGAGAMMAVGCLFIGFAFMLAMAKMSDMGGGKSESESHAESKVEPKLAPKAESLADAHLVAAMRT